MQDKLIKLYRVITIVAIIIAAALALKLKIIYRTAEAVHLNNEKEQIQNYLVQRIALENSYKQGLKEGLEKGVEEGYKHSSWDTYKDKNHYLITNKNNTLKMWKEVDIIKD